MAAVIATSSSSAAASCASTPATAWTRNPCWTSPTACCTTTNAGCWGWPSTPDSPRTAASSWPTPDVTMALPRSASSAWRAPTRARPPIRPGRPKPPSAHSWSSPSPPPCIRAGCSPSTTAACCSSAPGTAALATIPSVTGSIGGRCWASSCASTSTAAGPTPSRPTTASRPIPAPGGSSTPSACATHGASASTGSAVISTSAMWGRAAAGRGRRPSSGEPPDELRLE